MARKRRGTEKRALNALINVRMSPTLKNAIEREAQRLGLTPIAYVRQILVQAVPETDPADAVPIKARDFVPPPGIVHELASARETAAEAVGMLVQASRRYREMGMAETHADAEAVLRTMRMAAAELLDLSADIAREWRAFLASHGDRMAV
jgi:hypothetical protein